MYFTWSSAMKDCKTRRESGENTIVKKNRWFGYSVIVKTSKINPYQDDINPKDFLTLKKLKKAVKKEMKLIKRINSRYYW